MMRSTNVSDKDLFEAELIKDLMVSYFDIVRRNILDTVPKSIMYFLVNESKNRVQNELVAALYKEELFSELLEEGPQVASRRQACEQLLGVLKRAHLILNEVRDMPMDGTAQQAQSDVFSSMRY
jgi:dynamin 1-like protein